MQNNPEQLKLVIMLIKSINPKVAEEVKKNPDLLMQYLKKAVGKSKKLSEIIEEPELEASKTPDAEPRSSLESAHREFPAKEPVIAGPGVKNSDEEKGSLLLGKKEPKPEPEDPKTSIEPKKELNEPAGSLVPYP